MCYIRSGVEGCSRRTKTRNSSGGGGGEGEEGTDSLETIARMRRRTKTRNSSGGGGGEGEEGTDSLETIARMRNKIESALRRSDEIVIVTGSVHELTSPIQRRLQV
ncbi:hypothetical protein QE152_g32214 [Popillia japonica]|uniref:Uncharacterized protein n=1 Tax=Popillia japonica TaxID=7064 RepID=A0AAW1IZH6_POPJA